MRAIGFIDIRAFHYRAAELFTRKHTHASYMLDELGGNKEPNTETLERKWATPNVNAQKLMANVCAANGWTPVQTRAYCDVPSFRRSWFWHRMWGSRMQDAQNDGCVTWTPQQAFPRRSTFDDGRRNLEVCMRIGMDAVSAIALDQCDVVILFTDSPLFAVVADKVREFGKHRYIKLVSAFPSTDDYYHGIDRTDWFQLKETMLDSVTDANVAIPRQPQKHEDEHHQEQQEQQSESEAQ
jgi:hypothetical protein